MFFAAYIGNPAHEPRWRDELRAHAAWLGLSDYPHTRTLPDGKVFAYGWASLHPPDIAALTRDDGQRLVIIPLDALTRETALAAETPRGFETNATRWEVSLASGEVRVAAPAFALEQTYYASVVGGWLLANDMRFLLRMAGLRLDERAVYAVFQYSKIPAPLTISRTVSRVMPGHVLTLPADSSAPLLQRFFDAREIYEERGGDPPEERVRAVLDGVIAAAPEPVAVHFSGGVDSAVIAARLAALGRTDARLQNFTPGPHDPFHELAPKMAAHLGLPCEQVVWQPSDAVQVLETLAQEYARPFGDPASLLTVILARAMSRWPQRPASVMAGTGGAAMFAVGSRAGKFRAVYSVPRMLRRAVGGAYARGLWRSPSLLSRFAGAANKTVNVPLEYAASSSHASLNGFVYVIPPRIRAEIEQAAQAEMEAVVGHLPLADRMSLTAVLHASMCLCGARPFDPMRRRGVATVIPMEEPGPLRATLSLSWDEKCPNGVEKGVLKNLLARQMPREWVDWPKGRFLLPYQEAFDHPAVSEFVRDVVLAPSNPVLAVCRAEAVGEIFRRIETGQPIHSGARSFAWAMTFLSAWLNQMPA